MKDFDALEFKWQVQTRIAEAIESMTPAEEIAYYRRLALAGALGRWWTQVPDEHSTRLPSR